MTTERCFELLQSRNGEYCKKCFTPEIVGMEKYIVTLLYGPMTESFFVLYFAPVIQYNLANQ